MPYRKILAVDDDPMNRAIMVELLADDYDLTVAGSAEEALERARALRPDLVLLDIMMPGVDGYEACRRIRAEEGLKYTKVILVSAKSTVSERVRGYAAGADDYVVKPFDHAELLAKVRVFLRLGSMEEMDDIKSEFLALVSHETRTPLTKLLAASEMLVSDESMDLDERRHLAVVVRQTTEDLRGLLELGLEYCSLRADRVGLECGAFDAAALLREVVTDLAPAAKSRGAELLVGVPGPVVMESDRMRLAKAMQLMIESTLERQRQGGRVRIALEGDDLELRLTVQAPDPCLDPALVHLLLAPFRSPDLLHHTTGSVMKLPVAAELVRQLHGSISVELWPGGEMQTRLACPRRIEVAASEPQPGEGDARAA